MKQNKEAKILILVQKQGRRWKAWVGMLWCFGSQRQQSRMNKAVLFPEPTDSPPAPAPGSSNQSSGLVVAPPSSPSSFLQSDPPSTIQSPAKFFSLSNSYSYSYSPPTSSIFALGPYADDTKLVSPPVFSTFSTEPSTAPFTPPEPLHHTTPSSPEVPFARLLSYDFQPYQFHPGSPIGHLISPGSACSGTSSPFPDMEPHRFAAPDFAAGEVGDVSFEFTAQESVQGMKKQPEETISISSNGTSSHTKSCELESSREFKFNIEAEKKGDDDDDDDDDELGVLRSGSGSAWSQLNLGFAERTLTTL